jgi:predicted TIM-barrel fold metal-dependent hydrolase
MIIDIHAQIGKHPLYEFEQNLSEVLADMERYDIDKTFIHPVPSMRFQEANDSIAHMVEKHPDKLVGFFNVNPVDPKALDEFKRATDLGLKGLMLELEFHYSMERTLTPGDTYLPPLLEKAEEHATPILLSSPNIRVGRSDDNLIQMYRGLDELLGRFPEVKIIVDLFWPGILELCIKHSNLYIDTAGAFAGRILRLANQLSSRRLLFGSNSPRFHPGVGIQGIKWLRINPSQKKFIMGGNTKTLFKDLL